MMGKFVPDEGEAVAGEAVANAKEAVNKAGKTLKSPNKPTMIWKVTPVGEIRNIP